ncbi:MAG: NAD(P)-dependent oxidoreductase [Chloroflexi bacterium]|nr:NAD(P)-dependent oxidoreductase [Chloroflexota bacterium]
MNIGFVGVGRMGGAMAANLQKAGHALTVTDVRREAADVLAKGGARWAETPKACAAAADIVFSSLPGPKEVEAVALGKDGIVEGIRKGAIYIDLSTSLPTVIRRVYDVFKDKGASVMDAPVAGGPSIARDARLAVTVGGDEDAFRRAEHLLRIIGADVTYVGAVGNGCICKLMINCIVYSLIAIAGECFTAGVKAGVKPKDLWKAVAASGVGKCSTFQRTLPRHYFSGRFDPPDFSLDLALKDISLATALGREFNVPMAIGNLTLNDIMAGVNRGWGEKDSRIMLLIQEERAGVEVRIPESELPKL